MKVPLSWLKDFVEIDMPLEDLAHQMTMAGLEVEEIRYVGLPLPEDIQSGDPDKRLQHEVKIYSLGWDPEKIVVGAILEVMPHPNADRLVLCRLEDGKQEHVVLTGAPNLFPYKGSGPLAEPLKVAYAREGARLFDGHQPGQVLMTLTRAKIRGVDSYSMACSEKELGISEEHEGIIILDAQAPTGLPLVEYMGDAVFDIAITPNMARDANMLGVAREIAAITGKPLRQPATSKSQPDSSIPKWATIVIEKPELNPRFVLGLIEGVEIKPSPYEIQRRLRLAGMRPINSIVDATNYAMLELGEPLHAFDYDILVKRAGGKPPTIITRTAQPGETLTTLDGVEHQLDSFTVLVCDTAGALSIAGVMGGTETEVNERTRNVLLEGAAWNFTNIRRTISAQHMSSEAAYRFSRGVHPALAERGVRRGLELMQTWSGGIVADGLVDNYPLPAKDPTVTFSQEEVKRWLGIHIELDQIVDILKRLDFDIRVENDLIYAKTPDHRLDIGEGIIGVADIMEEIARIYGYSRIPLTRLADELPPQEGNAYLQVEEALRDTLVNLGMQEIVTYRMTSPEREKRLKTVDFAHNVPLNDETPEPYLQLANPMTPDRSVMRKSLLSSVLEIAERNSRLQERLFLFEIGKVFLPRSGELLPDEPRRLAILMMGARTPKSWTSDDRSQIDFYDLKGVIEALLSKLHCDQVEFHPVEHVSLHPGKSALIRIHGEDIGHLGELHPLVRSGYDLPDLPVLVAELDIEALLLMISQQFEVNRVPVFPPVLEDLAIVVPEAMPAVSVSQVIQRSGGERISRIELFDVYRGGQAGDGMKSLAYSLTYQAPDRTLTDQEVAQIRNKILSKLERELGARLRS